MNFTKEDTKELKGITICLMLCHHLFTFPDRLSGVSFISLPFLGGMTFAAGLGQFGKICVAMFALLSGYGLYLSSKKCGSLSKLISKHVVRLFSNFWKVFVFAVPISLLLGTAKPQNFVSDLIYCFLGLRFSYCSEWWFITPFAFLIFSLPVILRIVDRKNAFFPADVLWLVVFSAVLYYVLPEIMNLPLLAPLGESTLWDFIFAALSLFPAFAMGCLMAKYGILDRVKSSMLGKGKWITASLAVLAGLLYIHPYNWMAYDFINAALFSVCAVILLYTRSGRLFGRIFAALGEESTFMWLTHTLFCYHWCQKLVFAPRFALLIFLWLTLLSFAAAKLLRFIFSLPGKLFKKPQ